MNEKDLKNIARNALQLVEKFFSELSPSEKASLPEVLKSNGKWMAHYVGPTLAVFFLNKHELKRVTEWQNKGWPSFPGFIVNEDQKPANAQVAFEVSGSCEFFSSNNFVNMFAFSVKAGASFTVVEHHIDVKDLSGQRFQYTVALAFVLGLRRGEGWAETENRLSELLTHSITVWKKL